MYPLSLEQMLPAAGQGALALQCRSDDHVTMSRCLPLNDPAAAAGVHAERTIVASVGGDCHSPVAVLVHPQGGKLEIWVRVLSPDGRDQIELRQQATPRTLGKAVKQICAELEARGAHALVLQRSSPPTLTSKNLTRV
jgi:hydroxymethylbilane synthase